MSTDEHYYIEKTDDGRSAVRAKASDRASFITATQEEAIARVKELNSNDRPDVERVRNTQTGGRDKWRESDSKGG